MPTSTTPLHASTDGPHDITPSDVHFNAGPLAGTIEQVTRAHEIDGREAIVSFHGEGFYWLPALTSRSPEEPDHALWEPHPDARFSWSRYL